MRFFLGTHKVNWLTQAAVPLFVSHRQARRKVKPLSAQCDWALDSGGYTELSTYGAWLTTPTEYIDAVARYQAWGRLQWAAPQDWMCEPWVLEMTGKSIAEHQELTVENYLVLRGSGLPFIPCLQGQHLDDYLKHVELYTAAGVRLEDEALVGVGSVCRRQATGEVTEIFTTLAALGLKCHGFGVKTTGLAKYARHISSADSMAWSLRARFDAGREPQSACPWGNGRHKACNNCLPYALKWRSKVLEAVDG